MQEVIWRTKGRPLGGVPNNPADDLGVEVHHTATDDGAGPTGGADNAAELVKLCRSVWDYHVKVKGWADIFYGFIVARDGSFAVGRGFDRGTSSGHRWVTVCLAGNYDQVEATPAQVATVAAIRARAAQLGVGDQLRGHGDRDKTACPGEGGRWLLSQLAAGAGTPPPAPAAPAGGDPFGLELTWRPVGPGSRGALVRTVQAVVAHTFGQAETVGSIDGVYGKRTAAGVANVQRFFGLEPHGRVGERTAGVLLADWEALR